MAEEIEEAFLFAGRVTTARDLDLNLAAERDSVDRFVGDSVPDLQPKCEHGNGGEGNHGGGRDLEAEIRHWGLHRRLGFRLQLGEETADLGPDFGAARKAFPVGADKADQSVTLIDGGDVVLAESSLPGWS